MRETAVSVSPCGGNIYRVRLSREAAGIALDAIAPAIGSGLEFPLEAFEALMAAYFDTDDAVIDVTIRSDEDMAESLTALFAAQDDNQA